jgi:hypothetical protein
MAQWTREPSVALLEALFARAGQRDQAVVREPLRHRCVRLPIPRGSTPRLECREPIG